MILGIGIIIIAIMLAIVYNGLVSAKNQVENAKGAMDAMLKKRYDLLPNLVSVVKTYMNYEKDVLTSVTELRTKRETGNISDNEKGDLDNKIGQSMRSVMLNVENYPALKADREFSRLQSSWNECEEQIAASRRAYNAAITNYNNTFEGFPGSLFAKGFQFEHKQILEISDEERANVSAANLFKA
jgi:LemA protein